MGFIGSYPLQMGGAKIHQPMGGATACNVSVYIDSDGQMHLEPFVNRAPLNLNEDCLIGLFDSDINLNDGTERFFEGRINPQSGTLANEFLHNIGRVNESAGIVVSYDGTRLIFKWFNDSGNTISQIIGAPASPFGDWIEYRINISTTKFEVVIGGNTYGNLGITPASSTVNGEYYGCRARTGIQNGHVWVSSTNNSELGYTDFTSNQDDGPIFRNSNGKMYTLTDNNPQTAQIPGWFPNPDDILSSPATGGILCKTGSMVYAESSTPIANLADGVEREFEFEFTPDENVTLNEVIYSLFNKDNSSGHRIIVQTRTTVDEVWAVWVGDGGTEVVVPNVPIVRGVRNYGKITVSSTLFKLEIGTNSGQDSSINITNCPITTERLGGNILASAVTPSKWHWTNNPLNGYTLLDGRLPSQSGTDQILTGNGDAYNLSGHEYSPYIGDFNATTGAYRKEDIYCG